MADSQLSQSQMEDMVVVASFLEFLKTKGTIPQGVSTAEAFDNLRGISVWAPNAKHAHWIVEVGSGSGPLAQLRVRGTVQFLGDALHEALRSMGSLEDHVMIPAGTIVNVLSE